MSLIGYVSHKRQVKHPSDFKLSGVERRSYKNRANAAKVFGARLRELREEREMSQQRLADLTGLGRTYISDVERGARNPCLVNILKLSDTLRVAPGELFKPWA